MLYVGDLHLAVDYALWNIAEISIPGRLDIEQNWAVPEVTVTWVLGEDKIIELDVLSHRKVQAHVRFPPQSFFITHKSRNIRCLPADVYIRTDCGTTVHRGC